MLEYDASLLLLVNIGGCIFGLLYCCCCVVVVGWNDAVLVCNGVLFALDISMGGLIGVDPSIICCCALLVVCCVAGGVGEVL